MCNKISRIITSLTAWMKKCAVYVQIRIECVSMKENVVGFFWEKECVGTPQHMGPCWMLRTQ